MVEYNIQQWWAPLLKREDHRTLHIAGKERQTVVRQTEEQTWVRGSNSQRHVENERTTRRCTSLQTVDRQADECRRVVRSLSDWQRSEPGHVEAIICVISKTTGPQDLAHACRQLTGRQTVVRQA